MNIHAFTKSYHYISSVIDIPVTITNLITETRVNSSAIWDTGATNSVITKALASKLGLNIVGYVDVNGVHGSKVTNQYFCKISLNEDVEFSIPVTECEELSSDGSLEVLLGMDIITKGDFAITQKDGKTTMSYAYPSVHNIDFVHELNLINNRKSTPRVGRNQLCPCGSQKKYKRCCGID